MDTDAVGQGGEGAEGGAAGSAPEGQIQQGDVSNAQNQQTTAPNWDDEGNPYRQKFTGLQGNFKQVNTQLQQERAQRLQLGEQIAVLQAQVAGKSEPEIQQIRQEFQKQSQAEQLMEFVMGQAQQIEETKQKLMPAAKSQALGMIAQQYGVDAKLLEKAESPEEAVRIAEILRDTGRTQVLQQRKAEGTDRGESAGGGGLNLSKMSNYEMIKEGVRRSKQR